MNTHHHQEHHAKVQVGDRTAPSEPAMMLTPGSDGARQQQIHTTHHDASREPESEPKEHNQSTDGKVNERGQALAALASADEKDVGGRPPPATLPDVAVTSSEFLNTGDVQRLGLTNHPRGRTVSVSNEAEKKEEVHGTIRQSPSSGAK